MSMAELESIRDHVNYLRRFIPRSEWGRDDQWIVHLSTKIEAVLELHPLDGADNKCTTCHDGHGDPVDSPCETRRAIEEAGK